jgi:hypothetical protein
MRKKKYKHSELTKKRSHPKVGPLATEEGAKKIWRDQSEDEWNSVRQLCDEYGIEYDDNFWMNLAVALARDFVPAFQDKTRPGPKQKWTDHRRGILVVEIERIKTSQSISIEDAADELAKKEPWKNFIQIKQKGSDPDTSPDPGETLRHAYYESFDRRWLNVTRKAFLYHEATDTVAEWDAMVAESLVE